MVDGGGVANVTVLEETNSKSTKSKLIMLYLKIVAWFLSLTG